MKTLERMLTSVAVAIGLNACEADILRLENPPVSEENCPAESKMLSDKTYELRDFLAYGRFVNAGRRIVVGATDNSLANIAASDIAFGLNGLGTEGHIEFYLDS